MSVIKNYDPGEGDLCQGDVIIFRLPDGYTPDRSQPIPARDGQLILALGEMTGHHHAIWCRPAMFRDDAIAHAAMEPAEAASQQVGTSALYRDDALIQRLVSGGQLVTASLAIGILCVEGAPVVLRHQEHDAIRIPTGEYYVGRQQEFSAGEERRVAD